MSTPHDLTTPKPNRLIQFRQAVYEHALTRARDAQFELVEALLLRPAIRSFPELALSPVFRRGWPSAYAAIEDGSLDPAWLERYLAEQLPEASRPIVALDSTGWAHPEAITLAERRYWGQVASDGEPVAGHVYSLLAWVPKRGQSWALPLSIHRPAAGETLGAVGVAQVQALCREAKERPPQRRVVITADGAYGHHHFLGPLKNEPCTVVVRLRKNRVLYRRPPPYAGKGRPRKHGERFAFKDPTTWGEADETVELTDARWGQVRLRRWNALHAREDTATQVCVVLVESRQEREQPPAPIWLGGLGADESSVTELWCWFDHRAALEAGIRFRKQGLHWTLPRWGEPERCDRWTHLVTLAQWELYLARELVEDRPLPWQAAQEEKTPGRVQAGLGALFATMGRPTREPQTRGKSPGWPRGRVRPPRPRFSVVRTGRRKRRQKAAAA